MFSVRSTNTVGKIREVFVHTSPSLCLKVHTIFPAMPAGPIKVVTGELRDTQG